MSKTYTTHQNSLYEIPFTIDVTIKHTKSKGMYRFRGEVIINFEKVSSLVLPFQMTIFDEIHFNCNDFEGKEYHSEPIEKLWTDSLELLEEKSSYRELIQQRKEELLNEEVHR